VLTDLTVSTEQSAGAVCGCYFNEEGVPYYYPFSLKKKDNSVGSVGSVGCVGKSQKSPEISQ
jgi:hypothetical protein